MKFYNLGAIFCNTRGYLRYQCLKYQDMIVSVDIFYKGSSGGAKVLRKLPVPRRPTNLDYSRARACCACSRCGLGL